MAYAQLWTVRGAVDRYDRVVAEIGASQDGLIVRVVTTSADGFTVLEVWADEESAARFEHEVQIPAYFDLFSDTLPGERTVLKLHSLEGPGGLAL